jgi:Zn finger protein HypA/HybF involved in hydrogenase expression
VQTLTLSQSEIKEALETRSSHFVLNETGNLPLAGRCLLCDEDFFILEAGIICPEFRSKNVAAISGNELFIREVEVE